MCYHIGVMAKVAPEIKTRLMAEGTWKDFSLFRENAIKSGNAPAAAMRLAVAKFCPDLAGLPPCRHRAGEKSAKELAEYPSTAVVAPLADGGKSVEVAKRVDFSGKTCTMVAALDWVIDAMALDPSQVDPSGAPAAKAWSLYLMCRRSPSFAEDVISKAVVRQIPNGMREDETGDEKFAGEREYDILAALKSEGVC